ncbi:MAG: PKD domain-containing protein, partial [Thermoplasmata archaeon]|nr:PKD domain-containing protein [Thermoplasmata archaeon]
MEDLKPIKYEWDFDDGHVGLGETINHKFDYRSTPYNVTLTVTDLVDGTNTTTLSVTILNQAPDVSEITANPSSANKNTDVEFSSSWTDDTGSLDTNGVWQPSAGYGISSVLWEFGDGTTSSNISPTITHKYYSAGTFQVSLTVTDEDEGSTTVTEQITISNRDPTISGFLIYEYGDASQNHITDLHIGDYYIFDASTSCTDPDGDFDIVECRFDLGNGVAGVETVDSAPDGTFDKKTHIYYRYTGSTQFIEASYTARITVTDIDGGSDHYDIPVTVRNAAPVAHASYAPIDVDPGTAVRFDGTASSDPDGDGLRFNWIVWDYDAEDNSFTNEVPLTGYAPTYVFNNFSSDHAYKVALTVTDEFNRANTTIIFVDVTNAPPTTNPSNNTNGWVRPDTPVTFYSNSLDTDGDDLTYHWLITYPNKDGQQVEYTNASENFDYQFLDANADNTTAIITHRVIDEHGSSSATVSMTLHIQNQEPVAVPDMSTAGPVRPNETITFDAMASYDLDQDLIGGYLWIISYWSKTGPKEVTNTNATFDFAFDDISATTNASITLLVYDAFERWSTNTNNTLSIEIVNSRPTIVQAPGSAGGHIGDDISLDIYATDTDPGDILMYSCDFGDGYVSPWTDTPPLT